MITLRPSPRSLRFRQGPEAAPWRSADERVGVSWFSLGRDALGSIAATLATIADAVVWLPAYSCKQVLEPFASRGIRIEWYDVRPDLQIDWSVVLDARRRVRGTHVLLLIDYFGIPQHVPTSVIAELERAFSVVVRDAAQGLPYEGETVLVGRDRGFLVHSFRKPLPLPEGSILRTQGDATHVPPEITARDWCRARAFVAVEWVGLGVPKIAAAAWFEQARAVLKRRDRHGAPPFATSRMLTERVDTDHVRLARRANAQRLMEALRPYTLVDTIGPNACPYYLPLLLQDVAPVEDRFRQEGVEVTRFWSLRGIEDSAAHPVASMMSRHLLCLPTHQGLTDTQLDQLLDSARRSLAHAHPYEHARVHSFDTTPLATRSG